MASLLPAIRLTGAMTLRGRQMVGRTVAIADGRIATGPFPQVDLSGYLVLPGIIDLHHRPDPSLLADWQGLRALDRVAASDGVTTRCLAVQAEPPWSHTSGTALVPAGERPDGAMTDLRLQMVQDPMLIADTESLLDAVRQNDIAHVLFHNRLAGLAELRLNDPMRYRHSCEAFGVGQDEIDKAIDQAAIKGHGSPRMLCALAEAFDRLGVLYGSLQDRSAEVREHLSMLGARLCIDPATPQAAAAAHAVGDPLLIMGDRILTPRSGESYPDPTQLLMRGTGKTIVSGLRSGSPVQAAFRLVDAGVMSLPQAWRLISETPARILRCPDRGEIAKGKRADLVIIHAKTRIVEATITQGRLSFLCGEAVERFMGLGAELHRYAAE